MLDMLLFNPSGAAMPTPAMHEYKLYSFPMYPQVTKM